MALGRRCWAIFGECRAFEPGPLCLIVHWLDSLFPNVVGTVRGWTRSHRRAKVTTPFSCWLRDLRPGETPTVSRSADNVPVSVRSPIGSQGKPRINGYETKT